jgi:glycosyltransferase involved in cell wall biosynthesis
VTHVEKYYVCNTRKKSGIARYALDFNDLVMQPLGYTLVEPSAMTPSVLAAASPSTLFHVELGAMQFEERDALVRILRAGHRLVDVTLHDPPFLTFPYFHFRSPFLNRLSRGVDWYLGSLGAQTRSLHRLRRVFVLTDKGADSLRRRGAARLERIPHVVSPQSIWSSASTQSRDILYFGFIGPAKGIEYALTLHERIIESRPDVRMHVVGEAIGASEKAFFAGLQARYRRQVVYHGFVPEQDLDAVYASVRHVFLPFEEYRYFHPASGSVINSLKRGRVVWASAVNSVPELIQHRHNGVLLTKQLDADATEFLSLADDSAALDRIGANALQSARAMSEYPYARHFCDPC